MADHFDSPASSTQFDWEEVAKAFQAERDQLDQQVEALLSAVDQSLEILGSGECSVNTCKG